jgi:excisionase family DNA binding protein
MTTTYLTVGDLCAVYSVTPKTIHRWAETGRIPKPVPDPGTQRRWRAADVAAHLRELGRDVPATWEQAS